MDHERGFKKVTQSSQIRIDSAIPIKTSYDPSGREVVGMRKKRACCSRLSPPSKCDLAENLSPIGTCLGYVGCFDAHRCRTEAIHSSILAVFRGDHPALCTPRGNAI